jgi:hypothetical protein
MVWGTCTSDRSLAGGVFGKTPGRRRRTTMQKSPYYDEIKSRAIELLQIGCIDNHSIDELKSCGKFVRKTSISTALVRAMDEIQQRELSGLDSLQELKAARKRTRFSKGNHDKAATEIAKLMMEKR